MVDLEPVGNQTQVSSVGNQVESSLFDIFTDRYFLSQFQLIEEHKEVTHEIND